MIKSYKIINDDNYENIICSVSGGSDSDDVIDICERVANKPIKYIWFNTGLEYQATKDHLKYLEEKYGIEIESFRPQIPIPRCCKIYGQPFLSKNVSEFISRLQKHDFQWENESYDFLIQKYPKCSSALRWWCGEKGEGSRFNIGQNKYLKEFMLENPPDFKISNKCCTYAKKKVAYQANIQYGCHLSITGVRKAEGGARATAYKNCFTIKESSWDDYRPIFFYTDKDKREYEEFYGITHSKCYTEYGLKRTGCAGCPYGRDFEYELKVIEKYEPKLYRAICNIFKDSYEYTRKYRDFIRKIEKSQSNRDLETNI